MDKIDWESVMSKEIICINSYPTIKSHVNATVKTFKEAKN